MFWLLDSRSNYAGDLDDRRSTTRYVLCTFDGGPICWTSIAHSIVDLYTTIDEHMELAEATKEAICLARLVKELGVQQSIVQLHYDSQSVIYLTKN